MTVLLPTSVANANWFLVGLWVPVTLAAMLLHPTCRLLPSLQSLVRHRVAALWTLLALASLGAVLGGSLEVYYSNECPNSAVFHREIEALAKFVYHLCEREHVTFWVMFGNLLFVLRGQDKIPVGDTDSDVAVQKVEFMDRFYSMDNFTKIVQRDAYLELQRRAFVRYIPERELVQIYLDQELRGSHADIWLYKEERDSVTGDHWLVNEDRTIRAKRFPYEQVLPLAEEPAWFLGTPVGVPNNATYLARAEYGASFMTPMVTRMECIENVINGYAFYHVNGTRRRFFAFVAVATGALTLILANIVPSLRQLLVSPRKMGRPWLETREKDFV